jgi:hypothetical protein
MLMINNHFAQFQLPDKLLVTLNVLPISVATWNFLFVRYSVDFIFKENFFKSIIYIPWISQTTRFSVLNTDNSLIFENSVSIDSSSGKITYSIFPLIQKVLLACAKDTTNVSVLYSFLKTLQLMTNDRKRYSAAREIFNHQ